MDEDAQRAAATGSTGAIRSGNAGFLRIHLQRRTYLTRTVPAGIRARNGTRSPAKSSADRPRPDSCMDFATYHRREEAWMQGMLDKMRL
ncbi:hypothetical protein [Methylorubrum thiocyanatum]|uniref:hypothetical protein n=1 Tax=Methylorubrum thiocyanatum TaxID=47958 RepID=UPI0035C81D00